MENLFKEVGSNRIKTKLEWVFLGVVFMGGCTSNEEALDMFNDRVKQGDLVPAGEDYGNN